MRHRQDQAASIEFVKAFCISLLETPERTAKAQAHFKERGVVCQFFNGINAQVAGLRTLFPYEVDAPGSGFNIGPKPVGIWLSHYMVWSALTLLSEKQYLILEVDARFSLDWPKRFAAALEAVPPDFDMLYIGSCCCSRQPSTHIRGEVFEVKYPQCLHAYVVARKALPTLLSTQRKLYAPIDISLNFHSHPLLKVYAVLPRIVDQFDTEIMP